MINEFLSKLATGKRVLLAESDFDRLQALAITALKELSVYDADADNDAPTMETPTGAPLKLRSDWKERPRSKDLIIDLPGKMPVAEIERILKKAGLYLSTKKRRLKGFKVSPLSAITLPLDIVGMSENQPTNFGWHLNEEMTQTGDTIGWVFSRETIQLEAVAGIHRVDFSENKDHQAKLDDADKKLNALQDKLNAGSVREQALTSEVKDALAKLESVSAEYAEAQKQLDTLTRELNDTQSTQAALEEENDQMATALAQVKAEDNRFARLKASFSAYQTESQREVLVLQKALQKGANTGLEFNQLKDEHAELKNRVKALTETVNDLMKEVDDGRRIPKLPPITAAKQGQSLKVWHRKAKDVLGRQARTADRQKEQVRELKNQLRQAHRQLFDKKTPTSSRVKKAKAFTLEVINKDAQTELNALQAQLDLESERRKRAESRLESFQKRTKELFEKYEELVTIQGTLQAQIAQTQQQTWAAEADQRLLKLELDEKHAELDERTQMLETYASLQELLTMSLDAAEEARQEAEDGRRLADKNLQILQDEMERLQVQTDEGLQ